MNTALEQNTSSLRKYAKINEIQHGVLKSCVILIAYMVEKNKSLINDRTFDRFKASTGKNFPILDRQNPVAGYNKTYLQECSKELRLFGGVLQEDFLTFYHLTSKSLSFLNVVLSIYALAERISVLEENMDSNAIIVPIEMVSDVQEEVHKAIIHAAHLVLTKSPVIEDKDTDELTVKQTLLKLELGECELVYALNRSFSTKALYQMIDTNQAISDILAGI